ncbi:MAG TPA: amidohydrolase family protein [Solirubrobacteraceae bacterium]|nr:amidohydrolase family protein [Solirubrobacteraceae bacterium]
MPHRHPSLLAAPPRAPGRLWLTNLRLVDGTGAAVRERAGVLVSEGVVERVGDAADAAPDGARVLDLGGRMMIPGLINIHVHAQAREPQPEHGAEPILAGTPAHFLQAGLRDTLRMGVTTLRNVGGQSRQPQEARQAMRYGAFRGPRLLTCGSIISATAPGGRFYGAMYREADGPDEIRKAVREQLREGADFIKVMTTGARSNELEDPEPTQLTEGELAVLVEEAHRMGAKVAAHAEGLDGTAAAIEHGMDTIEHGMYLHQRPDLLERMAARGQVLVPTLSGYYWMAGLGEVIDPTRAAASPEMLPSLVALAQHNLEQGTRSMRAAREAGVEIALGSDRDGLRGNDTALELVRMVHHGLSPAEALRSATAIGSGAIGLQDYLGTVQPGRLADLVVIDGDLLRQPELLLDPRRVWLVLQLGEAVGGAALEASPALCGLPHPPPEKTR